MDEYTATHLRDWLKRQFPEDWEALLPKMIAQYDTDPEHYETHGWWRCYDACARFGWDRLSVL